MIIYKFKKDPFSSHKRMADYIFEENCRQILDVGCNRGQLLKALDGFDGKIWGVDRDEEVLLEIKDKYDKTILMDVVTDPFLFKDKFDAIVFGDILEHIEDPGAVIKKFLPHLQKSGIIIISVPNVANWVIRLQLFFGKFTYTINGILDRTHLRFYTLNTVSRMIENSGLNIVRIKTTPIPLPLLIRVTDLGKPLFFLHIMNYFLTKTKRTLFGYQFVLKCKVNK